MGQLYSHLVFRPPVPTYDSYDGRILYITPDKNGVPIVCSAPIVWLRNDLGAHIPAAWVVKPQSKFVVLFAHSNGDDLGKAMIEAQRISDALDISVLAFDYTGYGISEMPPRPQRRHEREHKKEPVIPSLSEDDRRRAQPSEVACYADIHCAYNYLVDECHIEPESIILVGRSIGSGPVVHCAATYPVGGVVLVAPIASAVRVALKRVNITLPLIDTFANIDKVDKIQCPVLIVHGDHDELVPMRHAELLLEKVRKFGNASEPLWIPMAHHNNVVEDNQSLVFGRYKNFLTEIQSYQERLGNLPTVSTSKDLGLGCMLRFLLSLPARAANPNKKITFNDKCTEKKRRSGAKDSIKKGIHRVGEQSNTKNFDNVTEYVSHDLSSNVGCLGRKRRRSHVSKTASPSAATKINASSTEHASFPTQLDSFSDLTIPSLSARKGADQCSDSALDEEFRIALLGKPSVSYEFISYPVDDNDRISLSIKGGLGKMVSSKKKQQLQHEVAGSPKIANCELPPLTDSLIQAFQMSAEWL